MSIQPGKYNFTIYQGATFGRVLTWKDENATPIDLTGYTARMHIRSSVDDDTIIASLTTENGGITLGGEDGTITLTMSAATTTAITADSGLYDLELVNGGSAVTRLLEGNVIISKEVTR